MNCEEVSLHLEPYLRGDLAGAEREWVSVHLATCCGCQQEAKEMEHLTEQLRIGLKSWVEAGEVPPHVMRQIKGTIRRESRPSWQRWAMMITAVAAAVVLAAFLVQTGSPDAGGIRLITGLGDLVRRPVAEVAWGTLPDAKGQTHVLSVAQSASGRGVTMTVTSVEFNAAFTGVDFTLTGVDTSLAIKDPTRIAGSLKVGDSLLPVQAGKAWVVRDGVLSVRAIFAPAASGQAAVFTLPSVPYYVDAPVTVPLALDRSAVTVPEIGEAATAHVFAWRMENGQAHVSVVSTGALSGYSDWELRDGKGTTYKVTAGAPLATGDGSVQELTAGDLGSATRPMELVGTRAIALRPLSLSVDLPGSPR